MIDNQGKAFLIALGIGVGLGFLMGSSNRRSAVTGRLARPAVNALSDEGAKALSKESAMIDFVRDAFGHLKAIAVDKGGQVLLKTANIGIDAGVVNANDKAAFIAAAKTRQWDREKFVRTLA
jgi:catalase